MLVPSLVLSCCFAVFCNLEADLCLSSWLWEDLWNRSGRGLGGEGEGIVGWIDGALWETGP